MIAATLTVVGLMLMAELAFTCLPVAKRYLTGTSAEDIPIDWKILLIVVMLIGFLGDIVFNVFRGTFIFRELPHEWLFSSRVQRHIYHPELGHYTDALRWALILNTGDPRHIKYAQ
jgi:hypothetical protein